MLLEVGSVVLASTTTDAFDFLCLLAATAAFSHNLSPELVFYFLDLEQVSPVGFFSHYHIVLPSIILTVPLYKRNEYRTLDDTCQSSSREKSSLQAEA